MSDYDDFDIDNLDDDSGTDVVKQLRKAYKAKQKEIEALRKQVDDLSSVTRKSVVEGVLAEHGVDARISRFVPESATTAEEVSAWLSENGDLFGVNVEVQESAPEVQAASRMAAIGEMAAPADAGDIMSRINSATSSEELNEILFGNSVGPVK